MNKIIFKSFDATKLTAVALKGLHPVKPVAVAKPKKLKPKTRQEICMNLTGRHINAARLLATIWGITESRERKNTLTLQRGGKKWVAMPRSEWAALAPLTEGQMKNSALPTLRERCSSFLDIRQMKLNPTAPKELWISIDFQQMQDALTPWDMLELEKAGGTLWSKKPKYPYKKDS